MRPTLLNFRSPKERTPAPYNPPVTCDGRNLFESPRIKTTIPHEKRFRHYDTDASKTGIMVGPGSYRDNQKAVGKGNIRGGILYRSYHKTRPTENNAYYMIGNHLVFDCEAPKRLRTKSLKSVEGSVDP
jgi:hypothetical protein